MPNSKTQIREHDYKMADETFKGKSTRNDMRLAEFVADSIKPILPQGYEPYVDDSGKVWIEIEGSGRIEARPKGAGLVDILCWAGSAGEESLLRRLPNANLRDALEFISDLLSSFDAASVSGGQYVSKADEAEAQDADMVNSSGAHLRQHFAGDKVSATGPVKEEPQLDYYYKDEVPEDKVSQPASQYDLSNQKSMVRKEEPSANKEIAKHMYDKQELPDKKKAQPVGNVVGAQSTAEILAESKHGKIEFLTKNTPISIRIKGRGAGEFVRSSRNPNEFVWVPYRQQT